MTTFQSDTKLRVARVEVLDARPESLRGVRSGRALFSLKAAPQSETATIAVSPSRQAGSSMGEDFANFWYLTLSEEKQARIDSASDDDPFKCLLSKHEDGNHSRSWFNGYQCLWCGEV